MLAAPAAASAASRYATPIAGATSGSCTQSTPCTLNYAVSGAKSGDAVYVGSGTYVVTSSVHATVPLTIAGIEGQPRPQVIGALSGDTLVLSKGGVARGLYLEADGNGTQGSAALSLDYGAVGDDIVAYAAATDSQGAAVSLKTSSPASVLRDSVAHSAAPGGEAISFKDDQNTQSQATTVTAINVTAIGDGVTALSGNMAQGGAAAVKNSIAVGSPDVSVKAGTHSISIANSNYRQSGSSGYTDAGGNQSTAPHFVNQLRGDFHEAADSPTIDAGATDSLLGAEDLDGNLRTFGAAPDAGAYEYGAPAAPADGGAGASDGGDSAFDPIYLSAGVLPPIATPVLGQTVNVRPGTGKVTVQLPGASRAVSLGQPATVPVGSLVDTTHGKVTLTDVRAGTHKLQSGTFWGGKFRVGQPRTGHGVTELKLVGALDSCSARGKALATLAKRRRRRRLWGRDHHGTFRTRGSSAAAEVRGTEWLTEDSCAGTKVRVKRGAVAVRDFGRRRTVLVRAGHSYLAHRQVKRGAR